MAESDPPPNEEQDPMNKLLIALITAVFAASPAYVAAQAKDEKKAEAKKDEKAAEAKKEEPAAEAKKETKKKPKGGC
jgi:Ni/Co efflux regulator RcnB